MGAGKSSAARRIEAVLDWRRIDIDERIEQSAGKPVAQIFADDGEGTFRELEERAIAEALDQAEPAVIALGGGALGSEKVRALLRDHLVVYLEVDAETAWARTRGKDRPLAQDEQTFHELFEQRRAVYEEISDCIIGDPHAGTPVRVAPILKMLCGRKGAGLLWARTSSSDYPVILDEGMLAAGQPWPLETMPELSAPQVRFTDANVARLYRWLSEAIRMTAGEQSKTLATVEATCSEMAMRGVTRRFQLVATGGGVVGDVGGFCAAVFQRGMTVVQVPTTVVAQVDSAYGGKTGVDLPEAKNYIGAYHQPAAVLVDATALKTLPEEELRAGYAEVVKTALIAGGALWERVRNGGVPSQVIDGWVVKQCARAKLAVVARDERDAGPRQVLNLGHTVGHAIESATGYGVYRHGEAVAIGMMAALRLSGQDELRAEVKELLRRAGLPTSAAGVDEGAVLQAIGRDKKREGDEVPFVLIDSPGAVTFGNRVSQDDLAGAVREVLT